MANPEQNFVSAALQWLRLGFSIVPIRAGEKRAASAWQAWQREPMSAARAQQEFSAANIGGVALVCGAVSNLTVLDFDGDTGALALEALEPLIPPSTPRVGTGGGGTHLYFAHSGEGVHVWHWNASRAGEVRGEGGYVLAPPSMHPSGVSYQWLEGFKPLEPMPAVLRGAILPKPVSQVAPIIATSQGQHQHTGRVWLERALARVGAHGRNHSGLWLACQLRDDQLTKTQAQSVLLEFAQTVRELGAHVYSDREALASLEQAYRRPARVAAVNIARRNHSSDSFKTRMGSRFGGAS
jgi:Bifunctional DNA primase/polymerase, N-terminal